MAHRCVCVCMNNLQYCLNPVNGDSVDVVIFSQCTRTEWNDRKSQSQRHSKCLWKDMRWRKHCNQWQLGHVHKLWTTTEEPIMASNMFKTMADMSCQNSVTVRNECHDSDLCAIYTRRLDWIFMVVIADISLSIFTFLGGVPTKYNNFAYCELIKSILSMRTKCRSKSSEMQDKNHEAHNENGLCKKKNERKTHTKRENRGKRRKIANMKFDSSHSHTLKLTYRTLYKNVDISIIGNCDLNSSFNQYTQMIRYIVCRLYQILYTVRYLYYQ